MLRGFLSDVCKTDHFQNLVDPLLIRTAQSCLKTQIVLCGHARVVCGRFHNGADPAFSVRRIEPERAGIRIDQTGYDPQKRRFAAAVLSYESDDLSARNCNGNMIVCRRFLISLCDPVADQDAVDFGGIRRVGRLFLHVYAFLFNPCCTKVTDFCTSRSARSYHCRRL